MEITKWGSLLLGLPLLAAAGVTHAYDCSGLASYVGGTINTGDKVVHNDHAYQCDVGGWCSQGGAYEPGVGWAWDDAWTDLGACASTSSSSSSSVASSSISSSVASSSISSSVASSAVSSSTASSSISSSASSSDIYSDYEVGLWRLASPVDRLTQTLDVNSGWLTGANYTSDDDQHWRLEQVGTAQYKLKMEETGQCLVPLNGFAELGTCSNSTSYWTLDTLRERTVERPALYHLKTPTNLCMIPNGTNRPTMGTCDNSARWYLEPVGFGERSAPSEYEVRALLLAKPQTNVPGLTQGSLASDVVSAAQVAFEDRVAYWFEQMTDGRVTWTGTSVVSQDPITSLTLEGGNYLPAAKDLPNDVAAFVPKGTYDTVQVFFTPGGSVTGGWGWGPGSSYHSNYTLWTTVNGAGTAAADWLSTVYSEPAEVFIHEPMHGYDRHFDALGLPLPDGYLHGGEANGYADSNVPGRSWLHWYRDYWLGTIIAADDTYRGYGPRMFAMATPREYALSSATAEYKVVQTTSSKCFTTQNGSAEPTESTPVVLSSDCTDSASAFRLESNGMLKHLPSGFCIHPYQGTANNGTQLVFFNSCTLESRLTFSVTPAGSLQHNQTGRCVHPQGGSSNPTEGTPLVFYDGCDEPRLQFNFVLQ